METVFCMQFGRCLSAVLSFIKSIVSTRRIAKEASATLRKEIRNAVSGSYSKLVSLSRGGGSGDHLDRQPSGLGWHERECSS